MNRLKLNNVGPIGNADIEFGDITLLVGPQAVGKSLFLQYLNLLVDYPAIKKKLKEFGFVVNNIEEMLGNYLGFEMVKSWRKESRIFIDDNLYELEKIVKSKPKEYDNLVFYIPAQRVLIMEDGWPKPFTSLNAYPYVVRNFSEKLRLLLESGFIGNKTLFPREGRFKKSIVEKIQQGIFRNSKIKLETQLRKRVVLEVGGDNEMQLPLSCWSSGQREFTPLLFGFYYLIPPAKITRKDSIHTVIIEELEMGLHPEAINSVMFAVMELLNRGYKVVISTHSTHVVEMIWALMQIKNSNTSSNEKLNAFGKLFDLNRILPDVKKIHHNIMEKKFKVYYFKPDKENNLAETIDISELDPGAQDVSVSGWGGLTEFSSNVVDIVADIHNAEIED